MNTEFGQCSFNFLQLLLTKIRNENPAILKASATVSTYKHSG